jgi:hypothetical protein
VPTKVTDGPAVLDVGNLWHLTVDIVLRTLLQIRIRGLRWGMDGTEAPPLLVSIKSSVELMSYLILSGSRGAEKVSSFSFIFLPWGIVGHFMKRKHSYLGL